jgi:Helix-turn-helix domain
LTTALTLFQQLWREYPLAQIREARQRHAALSAELDQYVAGAEAAPGRPALVRQELGKVSSYLQAAEGRLRRIDITVLDALLQTVDFATGRLFPAIESIAERAGCHRNSVIAALQRLRDHGFIAWVRRTVKTANEGEFAPQREQTSNAYYFEHRAKMAGRVFQRYCQLLVVKLRRLGGVPRVIADRGPQEPENPALRQALAALGAGVALRESAST